MPDERVAILEQPGDLGLQPMMPTNQTSVPLRGATAWQAGQLGGQLFSDLGQRVQDCSVDLLDDMELTDLMSNRAEHLSNRDRIQRRAIRGNASNRQLAGLERRPEPSERGSDVGVCRVVVEDFIEQSLVGAVVYDGQDTKRAVVQLVNGDVAREAVEYRLEVIVPDSLLTFFPPRPRSSSGPWQRGRRHGGRATDANWHRGNASRLRRPAGRR